MLSDQKDTDYLITQKLDDRDLLNLCAGLDLKMFKDEQFWKNRLFDVYGQYQKSHNKTWKTFYLQIVYYLEKYPDINIAMANAAQSAHYDLVKLLISKGADNWNWGMEGAAKGGHWDLVYFFIAKGADDWDWGLIHSSRGGHENLTDFFISKGGRRTDLEWLL